MSTDSWLTVSFMSLRSSRVVAVALVTSATFTDLVAYSIAVPVLPDLSRRLGASPTMIGLLFASFGVTVLGVSLPMGVVSDRIGRKLPMVAGLAALAASSLLLAFADRLPWLFAARLVQGAADAVTWVVGFALIADLYGPDERGRVMGLVMSGANFGFMIGPTLGGWLYEAGGIVCRLCRWLARAMLVGLGFLWLRLPDTHACASRCRCATVLRVPAVAACALAVVAAPARCRCSSRSCRCSCHPSFTSARRGLAWCSASPRSPRRHCTRSSDASRIAGAAVD